MYGRCDVISTVPTNEKHVQTQGSIYSGWENPCGSTTSQRVILDVTNTLLLQIKGRELSSTWATEPRRINTPAATVNHLMFKRFKRNKDASRAEIISFTHRVVMEHDTSDQKYWPTTC